MYAGSVAETGDVELVVKQPQHPYTQLLIGAVPQPNPEHAWRTEALLVDSPEIQTRGNSFCKFVARCPQAMPRCGETAPPLFQTSHHRLAACYLYEDAPAIRPEDMATVFVKSTAQ